MEDSSCELCGMCDILACDDSTLGMLGRYTIELSLVMVM